MNNYYIFQLIETACLYANRKGGHVLVDKQLLLSFDLSDLNQNRLNRYWQIESINSKILNQELIVEFFSIYDIELVKL